MEDKYENIENRKIIVKDVSDKRRSADIVVKDPIQYADAYLFKIKDKKIIDEKSVKTKYMGYTQAIDFEKIPDKVIEAILEEGYSFETVTSC